MEPDEREALVAAILVSGCLVQGLTSETYIVNSYVRVLKELRRRREELGEEATWDLAHIRFPVSNQPDS
jgi:hypothetical protein